jgi:hypothetical protein
MAVCGPEILRTPPNSASSAASYGRNYSDVPTSEESAHTYLHRGFPNAFKRKLPPVLDSDVLSRTPVRLDISRSSRRAIVDRAVAISTVAR